MELSEDDVLAAFFEAVNEEVRTLVLAWADSSFLHRQPRQVALLCAEPSVFLNIKPYGSPLLFFCSPQKGVMHDALAGRIVYSCLICSYAWQKLGHSWFIYITIYCCLILGSHYMLERNDFFFFWDHTLSARFCLKILTTPWCMNLPHAAS